jgi:hypothetical protein
MQEVRSFLDRYSIGQPIGSEQQLFDSWVEQIRARDPSVAELLAAGLRKIAASPSEAPAVARRLLAKLRDGASEEVRADDAPRSR